ncbi:hypothetical protein A3K48_07205 [candidate division WOR-1 bacterium RIFOXYA12_FULL_52_29]|uniref:Uncharacterized protein n=1 Tax=candidate division WOR-1 bacterium RIFOXYC12_FULL_54_18 TaxID=1802584 RepID=A0A1F4T7J3_UNCSA|nr:MAG: hypothetical protein A3K44_07205 [candidate division WOR-1 bacterium RIFOXYA2_FULL_51_19]OGC18305.1 MAG: hypothetical protein A3K48_07205 [candidate division WOR-1 bacterium RIFOXYA12_FULL_52_29]OGC27160.1 MAG: hypothetical protein A3K32_07200 [candidate division WOR-1 bacterium RIFOXYB2_FULL_45_9]OGC28722.1 MAG: hypothetical protein A3K49_07205 [candidate division WOR-1 bacterium RIFOXYC12_FULL_54_18]OGC30823.1 MAG: hypothetical protein A2346_05415 [candidate division WOR-1 bacterium R
MGIELYDLVEKIKKIGRDAPGIFRGQKKEDIIDIEINNDRRDQTNPDDQLQDVDQLFCPRRIGNKSQKTIKAKGGQKSKGERGHEHIFHRITDQGDTGDYLVGERKKKAVMAQSH